MDPEVADDYSKYLSLDVILEAQTPLSDHHDESLFIIIHQTTELWLKLILHELDFAKAAIAAEDLGPAFKALARVARIQHILVDAWQVLATMTPSDYLEFRHVLGTASGFQSIQYRALEFTLGRRVESDLSRYGTGGSAYLTRLLGQTSLYDDVLVLLHRRGFGIPDEIVERDWGTAHTPDDDVVRAWVTVYADTSKHWDLYELAEKLVDLEHAFSRWRFEHYQTVRRIIGGKRGTGGTAGLDYLKHALDHVYFPELWEARTRL